MKSIVRFFRSIVPIPLRKKVNKFGNFFVADLKPEITFPSIEGALQTLRQLGLRPKFCVDVGAYQGEWTTMFKEIFPETNILMVEAQDAKRPLLQQIIAHYPHEISMEMCLLGPTDGEILQFNEMETGSSVYAESSPYSRVTVEKATRRLDTLLNEGGYPKVDVLKLDVQGYELQILKGASGVLSHATAVLMEASLVPINQGCPLVAEVMEFMDSAGFHLFDFCSQIRRKDGVLWQTDLLFLRADSPILPTACLNQENWS